jgi:hypothetical protein
MVSGERQGGIPGYGYGTQEIARSPLTLEDLDLLKRTVLFSEEDEGYLRMAGDVLEGQVEEILDLWYGFVGDNPHLVYYFADAQTGEPLDYHHEIALRHTTAKKNETDGAHDTPDHIPLRYIIAFVYPITATIKPFLANEGHNPDEVDKMHDAWFKSVVMQVALWAYPYVKEGEH